MQPLANPIVVLYTDGGPDHNNTFLSVQLSLIALYLENDLDMLLALRTAPHQYWKNPCEKVNCILNLGLQAVGLMRARMDEKHEKAIASALANLWNLLNPLSITCFLDLH